MILSVGPDHIRAMIGTLFLHFEASLIRLTPNPSWFRKGIAHQTCGVLRIFRNLPPFGIPGLRNAPKRDCLGLYYRQFIAKVHGLTLRFLGFSLPLPQELLKREDVFSRVRCFDDIAIRAPL